MIGERRGWGPYGLLIPALALELVFVGMPLVVGVYYSFHSVRFFRLGAAVGWGNYLAALGSSDFRNCLLVTATFAISSLVLTFVLGFALALYLERDTRLHVLVRAAVLLPYMISMMVGSMLLKWMFSEDAGLFTLFLDTFRIERFSILADPPWSR